MVMSLVMLSSVCCTPVISSLLLRWRTGLVCTDLTALLLAVIHVDSGGMTALLMDLGAVGFSAKTGLTGIISDDFRVLRVSRCEGVKGGPM